MFTRLLNLLKNRYVQALIACAWIIVGVSWYRAWYAGTIIVDGHNLNAWPETFGFTFYAGALLVFCLAYYKLWKTEVLDFLSVRLLSYLLVIIFSFMLPLLSNDVFSLIAYGDAANKGMDVYTNTHCLYSSVYFGYVSKFWQTAPCAYGPVCLVTARFAAWVGDGNMSLALFIYKLTALPWAFLYIEMALRLAILLRSRSRKLLFVLLSPFFLLQGVAQLHCDAIAATLALCGVYFVFTQRWYIAFAFGALCVAVKINYVLVFPFLVVGLYINRKDGWRKFMRRGAIATGIYLASFWAVYMGVYKSPETFMVTFRFVFDRPPSKSIAELVGGIFYFVPKFYHHDYAAINDALNGKISAEQFFMWDVVKRICQVLATITGIYIMFRFWNGKRALKQWFRVYVRLVLLFLLFFSHVFFAWYLIMIFPFLWINEEEEFMNWLFALSFLVNIQDIVCVLSRNSTVYFIAFSLTVLSIIAYLWRFRKMFVQSLGYGRTKAPDAKKEIALAE